MMSPPDWTRSWRHARCPHPAAMWSGVTSLEEKAERTLGLAGGCRGKEGRVWVCACVRGGVCIGMCVCVCVCGGGGGGG